MEKWIEPHKGNILHQDLQSGKEMQSKNPMNRVLLSWQNNVFLGPESAQPNSRRTRSPFKLAYLFSSLRFSFVEAHLGTYLLFQLEVSS